MYTGHASAAAIGAAVTLLALGIGAVVLALVAAAVYIRRHK